MEEIWKEKQLALGIIRMKSKDLIHVVEILGRVSLILGETSGFFFVAPAILLIK